MEVIKRKIKRAVKLNNSGVYVINDDANYHIQILLESKNKDIGFFDPYEDN